MFAVIYSGKIKPEREEEYMKLWHIITEYFVSHCGALGSCLHRTTDNTWVAYSRWPDKSTRDAAFLDKSSPLLTPEIIQALDQFKDCILEQAPEICLEVVDDLLLSKSIN